MRIGLLKCTIAEKLIYYFSNGINEDRGEDIKEIWVNFWGITEAFLARRELNSRRP